MYKLTLLFLTLVFSGCSKDFKRDLEAHKFDSAVIQRLPQYDTLRQIILKNYDTFHLSNSKYTFSYIHNFDSLTKISGYSNTDIPEIMYPQTVQLFKKIGRDNISGFTVSKDSTIEFSIRNTHLTKYYLDVREKLYWYPHTNKIIKPEFPMKDTILSDAWQYMIWYDKRAENF